MSGMLIVPTFQECKCDLVSERQKLDFKSFLKCEND